MSKLQEHNSKASEEWAKKKKSALLRANYLREERKRSEEESVRKRTAKADFPQQLYDDDATSVMPFGSSSQAASTNRGMMDTASAMGSNASLYHGESGYSALVSESHGGNVQHIKIRHRSQMGEQGGVNMSQGGRGGGGRGLDPIAADERFGPDPSKNISEIVEDRRRASRVLTIAPPASGHAIGSRGRERVVNQSRRVDEVVAKSVFTSGVKALQNTFCSTSLSSYPAIDGGRFNCPPRNTEGVLFDVSAQMILCAAARGNELIVGTADHALYSLDVTSAGTVAEGGRGGKKPVTTMYPKRGGHREWVTDVGFLADGRVASVGMDGLMCVWDKSRIACQDIEAHRGSVSCLVTDEHANLAITGGYDKTVKIWAFDDVAASRRSTMGCVPRVPEAELSGHSSPVLLLKHSGGQIASGARDGSLFFWNIANGALLKRYRAHKGQVSALTPMSFNGYVPPCSMAAGASGQIWLSGGTDGMLKLWDAREKASVMTKELHTPSGVGVLEPVPTIVSPGSLVMSGGADNFVHLLDARRNLEPIYSWQAPHKNCIYSCLSVGMVPERMGGTRGAVGYVADGTGMVYCYDLSTGEMNYGLGASSQGSVRCMAVVGDPVGHLAVCGEDGNVLIFDHVDR